MHVEPRHAHAGHAASDGTLDRGELLELLGRHERDRLARGVHPPGATDPVHVVLGRSRHVVVDHVRHVVDVDAARGDVRRHEHVDAAVLEVPQRALALALRAIAVQRRGAVTRLAQPAREPVAPCLVRVNTIAV
jgi:predicted nucleotidyltransferase